MIQRTLAALMENCIWVSPLAGFLITVPASLVKRKFLPSYLKLKSEATRSVGAKRRLLIHATVQTAASFLCLLIYPWLLEWWFGARGLFDMIPGYSTCALLYAGGLVLGMFTVPPFLGVPIGWPAAGDGTGAQHRTE